MDAHCDRCSGKRIEPPIPIKVDKSQITAQLKKEKTEPQDHVAQTPRKFDYDAYMRQRYPRPPIHTLFKTCTRCDFEGHGEHFGWARKYGKTLNPRCRNCQRELAAEYRNRPGVREKMRQNTKEYRKTHKGKMANLRYYHRNKGKFRARAATGYAMRNGTIPHPTTLICKACGNPAEEYHHRNYEELLNVVPVCVVCHRAAHRKYEPRAIEEKRAEYMNEDLYDPVIP